MEFLFLNHSASIEAIIIFIAVFLVVLLLAGDMIAWGKRKFIALNPRKAYTLENSLANEESNSLPPPITLDEVDTTLSQVSKEGEKQDEESISELLEEIHREDLSHTSTTIEPTIVKEKTDDTVSLVGSTDTVDIEELSGAPEGDPQDIDTEISISGDVEEVLDPNIVGSSTSSVDTNTPSLEGVIKKDSRGTKDTSGEMLQENQNVPPEKREKLFEMVHNIKTLIARGHIDDARALIVNGLAIDKHHSELNLLMASLYERDHSFEKAEFILKDVAESDPDNTEVLIRLATVLAMQRKFDVAYALYKKVLSLTGDTEETLYTLVHIASELGYMDDILLYAKSYLKQYPKNPEILWLYSQAQITNGERKGAVETLIKLKNLTPYNQEIVDLIGKLVTEEELAGNFGEEKNTL